MQINLKIVTTFVVIAAILACVVYFGRIYEGFTNSTMPSSDDPTADSITPGSRAPNLKGAYNHFTQTSEETLSGTFYSQNPQDGSITVSDQNTLQLNLPNGETITLTKQQDNKEGFVTSAYGTFTVYTASNGAKATIVNGSDGQTVIRLKKANGEVVYYSQNGAPTASTAPYDTTTTSVDEVPLAGPTTTTTTGTSTSTSTTDASTLPSNQSSPSTSYSTYPAQTTYNTYSPPRDYTSALPPGIPSYMIPPGQEDLYILKSEIVPPVCPKCPNCKIINSKSGNGDCPKCKCPAPQPCPQDDFECKKVPNYNAVNNMTLPVPVLSDFSTFGM